MFRSLRWRLLLLFGLSILLTVVLSGALSAWFTFNHFDVLVSDEGSQAAAEIAPILAAYYGYHGNWEGLADLLQATPDSAESDTALWESSIDWFKIAAETLQVDEDKLWNSLDEGGSLADTATSLGVDPQVVVQAIVDAERSAMADAVAAGELDQGQMDAELRWIGDFARGFVFASNSESQLDVLAAPDDVELTAAEVNWLLGTSWQGVNFLVTDEKGTVRYDSTGESVGQHLPAKTLEQGAPLFNPNNDTFIGYVLVPAGTGYYTTQQSAFLNSVLRSLVISGLVAGLLALVAGLLIARRVTAPVTALTQAAQRLAEGGRPERLPVQTDDELGQMSVAFNQMARAIEQQRDLRTRLVHDISHELYTPLSIIQLEVEAIKDGLQTPQEASEQLQRETNTLRKLIDDLALLAEMETGEVQLRREPVDLGHLLSEAVQRWHSQAEAAGVSLDLAPSQYLLPEVEVDPRRMAQVLGNLIANAIHYTPAGGHIDVGYAIATTSNPIHESRSQPEGASAYVHVTIADTGEGIADEDIPFVFERFYRTDRARSRWAGGRGLGLAIVREIIEHHGGEVWVKSTSGEGSTFGFSIPLKGSARDVNRP